MDPILSFFVDESIWDLFNDVTAKPDCVTDVFREVYSSCLDDCCSMCPASSAPFHWHSSAQCMQSWNDEPATTKIMYFNGDMWLRVCLWCFVCVWVGAGGDNVRVCWWSSRRVDRVVCARGVAIMVVRVIMEKVGVFLIDGSGKWRNWYRGGGFQVRDRSVTVQK